jgi:hypothetical protein
VGSLDVPCSKHELATGPRAETGCLKLHLSEMLKILEDEKAKRTNPRQRKQRSATTPGAQRCLVDDAIRIKRSYL